MATKLDLRIKKIENMIMQYLADVKDSFSLLKEGIQKGDAEILYGIISKDKMIDAQYYEIFDRGVWLITREKPYAKDIRTLIALLFISRELERVADASKAVSIILQDKPSKEISSCYDWVKNIVSAIINQLSSLEKEMLELDPQKALLISEHDKKINQEYEAQILEVKKSFEKKKNDTSDLHLALILILTKLEKGADHIASIGQEIFYIEKGYHYE